MKELSEIFTDSFRESSDEMGDDAGLLRVRFSEKFSKIGFGFIAWLLEKKQVPNGYAYEWKIHRKNLIVAERTYQTADQTSKNNIKSKIDIFEQHRSSRFENIELATEAKKTGERLKTELPFYRPDRIETETDTEHTNSSTSEDFPKISSPESIQKNSLKILSSGDTQQIYTKTDELFMPLKKNPSEKEIAILFSQVRARKEKFSDNEIKIENSRDISLELFYKIRVILASRIIYLADHQKISDALIAYKWLYLLHEIFYDKNYSLADLSDLTTEQFFLETAKTSLNKLADRYQPDFSSTLEQEVFNRLISAWYYLRWCDHPQKLEIHCQKILGFFLKNGSAPSLETSFIALLNEILNTGSDFSWEDMKLAD